MAEAVIQEIVHLYHEHGDSNYLGEDVTKSQHSIQCALLAEKEGQPPEIILGALLHDIGHLIGLEENLEAMETEHIHLGAADHDLVGAEYLRKRGFPDSTCSLVKGHVNAKRYLVYKDEDYYSRLSMASKMTLVHQGGPMTEEEADKFEKLPKFSAIIKMRTWDEQAKDPDLLVPDFDHYKDMMQNVLVSQ